MEIRQILSNDKFIVLPESLPYQDCFLHKRQHKTRQAKYGMRVLGILSGRTALLYLCENCLIETVYDDGNGHINYDANRARCS